MTQPELDALLVRWRGGPGITQGLNHEEMIAMFQALIDSGRIYTMDEGMTAAAEAYTEAGWLNGLDLSKVNSIDRNLLK